VPTTASQWTQRARRHQVVTRSTEHPEIAPHRVEERAGDAGLPAARLTRHQHHRAAPGRRIGGRRDEGVHLGFALEQSGGGCLGCGGMAGCRVAVATARQDRFVVIDWSMGGLVAVGCDLGQLLIGLAHAGQLDIQLLPAIHDVILGSYTAGLAEEVDEELVRYGFDAALVVRSAFTALPLERLAEPPTDELAEQFAYRARLTRYLVDLGLSLPGMARSRHP
jgi:hypothetical protein